MYIPPYLRDIHGTAFLLNPVERELFYRDDLHQWYIYNGAVWVPLGGPGMVIHGNIWHNPAFATQANLLVEAAARAAADAAEAAARAAADAAHAALTAVGIHGSAVLATPSLLVHRDAAGRSQIVNPAVNADIDNLGARDAAIAIHAALATVHQDAPALIAVHSALVTGIHGVGASTVDSVAARVAAIAAHAALTTGTHGVGTGTIPSVSTANKTIWVDLEATGTGDGTSKADAYTSPQTALDAQEDSIIHAYIMRLCAGTKKTGTADLNVLNKLHDTGEFPAATTWVGRRVFNIAGTGPGNNWGVISARDSDDQLSIVDTAGVALDLFPNGNEAYVIEPTPYRETIYLNSNPTVNPAKLILGSLTIEAEYYWQGDCEANVGGAGEITDAGAFADVAIGDKVFILDLNGAGGRAQDYELCTVDDISNIPNRIGTNGAKVPAIGWRYVIVRTEISGSDDGTDGGTARTNCIQSDSINKVNIYGFYYTFSDGIAVRLVNSRSIILWYFIMENCDNGIGIYFHSYLDLYYGYIEGAHCLIIDTLCGMVPYYLALKGSTNGILAYRKNFINSRYVYYDDCPRAVNIQDLSCALIWRSTIDAGCAVGLYTRGNSYIGTSALTNNAAAAEDDGRTAAAGEATALALDSDASYIN